MCIRDSPALSLAEAQTEIIVFAAASMTETLTEIKTLYEAAHPGIVLTYNFDSSGTLKTQIDVYKRQVLYRGIRPCSSTAAVQLRRASRAQPCRR